MKTLLKGGSISNRKLKFQVQTGRKRGNVHIKICGMRSTLFLRGTFLKRLKINELHLQNKKL